MSHFIRASKYRHVFCDNPRADATYTNFRLSTTTGEQNYIKANPLYFAVGVQVSTFVGATTLQPLATAVGATRSLV